MTDITISVPEPFAEQLQNYATAHQISLDELTTAYWQKILQDDIDALHLKELENRWSAYENREIEMLSNDAFNAEIEKRIGRR